MKRILLTALALTLMCSAAEARRHHHRGHHYAKHHHVKHHHARRHVVKYRTRRVVEAPKQQSFLGRLFSGGRSSGGSGVISEMRRHIGGNPTGWARVWCGVFLDMALRRNGKSPGSPVARAYASYGKPAPGPAPGAIVVWPHHVGVVTAVNGKSMTVISGNDGHRVRERERTFAGVIAYRWP